MARPSCRSVLVPRLDLSGICGPLRRAIMAHLLDDAALLAAYRPSSSVLRRSRVFAEKKRRRRDSLVTFSQISGFVLSQLATVNRAVGGVADLSPKPITRDRRPTIAAIEYRASPYASSSGSVPRTRHGSSRAPRSVPSLPLSLRAGAVLISLRGKPTRVLESRLARRERVIGRRRPSSRPFPGPIPTGFQRGDRLLSRPDRLRRAALPSRPSRFCGVVEARDLVVGVVRRLAPYTAAHCRALSAQPSTSPSACFCDLRRPAPLRAVLLAPSLMPCYCVSRSVGLLAVVRGLAGLRTRRCTSRCGESPRA